MILKPVPKLVLLATLAVLSLNSEAATPRVHNYAKTFQSFWQLNQGLTLDSQLEAFKREVIPVFPQFYNYKINKWKAQDKDPDQEMKRFLSEFPKIEKRFNEKADQISQEIEEALKSFQVVFDDFNTDFDIYVVHSFGEMDGGIRELEGKSTFIFGIDGILKYHTAASDVPFFHHELFHVYHFQNFQPGENIWSALWGEGLATYVSKVLNPAANFEDIMLDIPKGVVRETQEKLPELKPMLKGILESESGEEYAKWFLIDPELTFVPKRAGYYFGYLIAEKIHGARTLKELARLNGASLLVEIREALEQIK